MQGIPQDSLIGLILIQRTSNSGELNQSKIVNEIEFLLHKLTPPLIPAV